MLSGTIIENRYVVGERLGSGAMGAVYVARQAALDRQVALKVLHPAAVEDQTSVRRFFVEARAAASIQHPNVVEVIDFGQLVSGEPYIVMEHLAGRDLATLLRDNGPLRWSRVRVILRQVLSGLQAAHAADVLHRDIKPSNVFILDEGQGHASDFAKLVDFGIAKFVDHRRTADRITEEATVLGTASYLAPELLTGTETNARTDVYSVGVLAYKMLTGRVPFRADSFLETVRMAATEPVPSLRSVCPELTIAAQRVVLKALAKTPGERYSSASEFLAAIVSLDAAGRPGASGPTGTAVPARRVTLERRVQELQARRVEPKRGSRMGYVGVLGLAVVGMLATWWFTRAAPQPASALASTPALAAIDAPPPPPVASPEPELAPRAEPEPEPKAEPEPEPTRKTKPKPKKNKRRAKKPTTSKASPEPVAASTKTDAQVRASLGRKLRNCRSGELLDPLRVKLSVNRKGTVTVVEVSGAGASTDETCVYRVVRAAKFAVGEPRSLAVTW